MRIILTSPHWRLNGVNVFSADLVRGLIGQGVQAEILLTRPPSWNIHPMPLPTDIPVRYLTRNKYVTLSSLRKQLTDYLKAEAPCIYLPNYDFQMSSISPSLPDNIRIVGIVHSDDPDHYGHARRLRHSWNALVCVSMEIEKQMDRQNHTSCDRIRIPYGIPLAEEGWTKPERHADEPIRIIYAGRLVQYQKNLNFLVDIVRQLDQQKVNFKMTLVGGGPARKPLERKLHPWIVRSRVRMAGILSRKEVLRYLENHDIFLLPSRFEGLPLALLEAMSRGCVPITAPVRSGVTELVQDGFSGFTVKKYDVREFTRKIKLLDESPETLNAMSQNARQAIGKNQFGEDAMVESYLRLFTSLSRDQANDHCRRSGRAAKAPVFVSNWPQRYLEALQGVGDTIFSSRADHESNL